MQLKGTVLAAAALALAATSANARPHQRDHRPLKIVIETVDHQRYPTAGDWQLKPDGLHIFVSRMSDQRYEFLVGMHEEIEAYLCKQESVIIGKGCRCIQTVVAPSLTRLEATQRTHQG